MRKKGADTVVLGAGLSGLSAGYTLSKAGRRVVILEKASEAGGLARTVTHGSFRFDLGGHRFMTDNPAIESLVKELLRDELLVVPRKSRIYMLGRYFDYPLNPVNAVSGLGIAGTLKIIFDYCREQVSGLIKRPVIVSLEDWVVNRFGREMFELYFRQYSEKVWGIDCKEISMEWVAGRIDGLSLWKAVKNSLFKLKNGSIRTLTDKFYYPLQGIGQLSERLKEEIERENTLLTGCEVAQIHHENFSIKHIAVCRQGIEMDLQGREYISSIPVTGLVKRLYPRPPYEVLEAASKLKFRDLVIVVLMLNRRSLTDLTWMYLPEKEIPFGRIHEPKNWSPFMSPKDKTHVVAEYFCSKGDGIREAGDGELAKLTIRHLERLGFIAGSEVLDTRVLRVPNAYPVFDLHYKESLKIIMDYLDKFENLHMAGRNGKFSYLNMDRAMESGIEAAEAILKKPAVQKEKGLWSKLNEVRAHHTRMVA